MILINTTNPSQISPQPLTPRHSPACTHVTKNMESIACPMVSINSPSVEVPLDLYTISASFLCQKNTPLERMMEWRERWTILTKPWPWDPSLMLLVGRVSLPEANIHQAWRTKKSLACLLDVISVRNSCHQNKKTQQSISIVAATSGSYDTNTPVVRC